MCENKAVLYGKMAQVMGILNRVKETGKHQQGWRYATSEDVKDAVRVAMAEVGLALLVSLEDHEVINLEKGILVRGTMAFTLCCSETGATETRQMVGEAADQSKVSDKAFYKLYTTLQKYFLKSTFLISSGDELDSDADSSQRAELQSKPLPAKTEVDNLPWQEKSPTKLDFFARAGGTFNLENQDIIDQLKSHGFDQYTPAKALEMWAVLKKVPQSVSSDEPPQNANNADADQPALIDPEREEDEGRDIDDPYSQMFES